MAETAPTNPFAAGARAALPRVLAMIDTNPASPTLGVADRYHWAWKGIDFPNGTMQGLANGIARVAASGVADDLADAGTLAGYSGLLIDGLRRVTRRDGSLDEIMPREASYCVTSLAAYDALVALDLLGDRFSGAERGRHLETIEPLIRFTRCARERHGRIANHLASAHAALARWRRATGTPADGADAGLRDALLSCVSTEGWLSEYGGADPGYQTRCIDYLVDAAEVDGDDELRRVALGAARFVSRFTFHDGSFGGLIGHRVTRVYSPGGIARLAEHDEGCARLTAWMAGAVAGHRTVTLGAVDAGNFPSLFSSYAWAAAWEGNKTREAGGPPGPMGDADFPEAGLAVRRSASLCAVVAVGRGGVVRWSRPGGRAETDAGVLLRGPEGGLASSQSLDEGRLVASGDDRVVVESPIRLVSMPVPTPLRFAVLRLVCVVLFPIPGVRDLVKKTLVRMLISKKPRRIGTLKRTIGFGEDVSVHDEVAAPEGWARVPGDEHCTIHMSSRGYWQAGDRSPVV